MEHFWNSLQRAYCPLKGMMAHHFLFKVPVSGCLTPSMSLTWASSNLAQLSWYLSWLLLSLWASWSFLWTPLESATAKKASWELSQSFPTIQPKPNIQENNFSPLLIRTSSELRFPECLRRLKCHRFLPRIPTSHALLKEMTQSRTSICISSCLLQEKY